MQYDRKLIISVGQSRTSKNWQPAEFLWSEFIDKLRTPQRTAETIEEYFELSKSERATLKDIGGFVGGTLSGRQRKSSAVISRDLVTLDMDNIAAGETDNVLRRISSLGAAYAVYSTRSHANFRPRLRVVIPLDKGVPADEYEPIARKIASLIGIELCDPTTFEAVRLMYWPGCSKNSEYIFSYEDKPFVSAAGILNQFEDWHDVRTWPQVPGSDVKAKMLLAKQQDPTTKTGIVGAFCRTYNILEAAEKFIPNAYTETDKADRLTYTGGTTIAGAVLYDDDKFLNSHHATDPCSGLLVNSFDLVRLHLFGDSDDLAKDGTPTNRLPSFLAMRKLALGDADVATELNMEMAVKASDVFHKEEQPASTSDEVVEVNWMKTARLETDPNTGKYKKTADNIIRIMNFDPLLKGKIAIDDFSVRGLALGSLPWNDDTEKRLWTDTDDAGLTWYLENRYEIVGKDKISAALMLVSEQNKLNEVKDYLDSLIWDGVPRLETTLHDYLGADNNEYTRAVARKAFTAAVARVMEPGIKYDYMPVLVGPQGIGKSTFLATMGRSWFSDSLQTFEGKEAAELIQGMWLVELGEMTGYTRSEEGAVKQFLSKREDIYRQAYGRRTGRYPRKCVFFGTCNKFEFLKDLTGNRRFWPVDVGVLAPNQSIWNDLLGNVDQLWAEAKHFWHRKEPLYFEDDNLANMAKGIQELHREVNVKEGLIKDFLSKEVPDNYDTLSLNTRKMFWAGTAQANKLVPREKTCALELWCECLHGDIRYMKRQDAQEINLIMENMTGWTRNKSIRRYGYCGIQRGFENIR